VLRFQQQIGKSATCLIVLSIESETFGKVVHPLPVIIKKADRRRK